MPAVGGCRKSCPCFVPWHFALHPSKPQQWVRQVRSPQRKKVDIREAFSALPAFPVGRAVLRLCLLPSRTAHQPPSLLGSRAGGAGVSFPAWSPAPGPMPALTLPWFLCLPSDLTLKRDHTSLSGLSEGCQLPSDPASLCGRGEGPFVGRVGTPLGWGRKGSRTAARGFGSLFLRKPWVGWGA